jgi:hypothetical protein
LDQALGPCAARNDACRQHFGRCGCCHGPFLSHGEAAGRGADRLGDGSLAREWIRSVIDYGQAGRRRDVVDDVDLFTCCQRVDRAIIRVQAAAAVVAAGEALQQGGAFWLIR